MQKLVVSFTHIVIGMTGTVFTEKNKAEGKTEAPSSAGYKQRH